MRGIDFIKKRVYRLVGQYVDKEILEEKIINVVGRKKEMEFLDHLFRSDKDMNILFVGSPATGKSLILKNIERRFKDKSMRFDFSTTTGKGFINQLIDKKLKRENGVSTIKQFVINEEVMKDNILLLDEVDKMKPTSELSMLLQLLEGKEILYVKYRHDFRVKFTGRLRVFASCNKLDKLSDAFKSRFVVWPLRDYTLEEYVEVGRRLAEIHLEEPNPEVRTEIATAFAKKMYEQKNTKDLRQLSHYMKMWSVFRAGGTVKTVDEILTLIDPIPEEEEK